MNKIKTHTLIREEFSGKVKKLEEGVYAKVVLKTSEVMAADEKGLVHGGFIFSLADYAAMVCVNEPTVVLKEANIRFKRPVKTGDVLEAHAKKVKQEGKYHTVEVKIKRGDTTVAEGEFIAVIPPKHVLDIQ